MDGAFLPALRIQSFGLVDGLLSGERMPRVARRHLVDLGSTHHCTFRSHSDAKIFDQTTATHYLSLLKKYKSRYGILVHSYCLMGTHPHLVVTATLGQEAFSRFFKVVNHQLAWHYNRRSGGKGQVVRERLRSPVVQPDERHLLTVMRYGDLNPVRASLVASPKDWPHSSFRHYAYGEVDPLIDDAPDYLALAQSPAQRRLAYRNLFAKALCRPLLERRIDLVRGPFIGTADWAISRMKVIKGQGLPSN